jgi:hypothetical protein
VSLRTDIITVHPVGAAPATAPVEAAGDARQEAFERSLAGLIGKEMRGEVLAKLADGSSLVRVAGSAARLMLPVALPVGAEVPLTLVAMTPRPTFEVGAERTLSFAAIGAPLPANAAPTNAQGAALLARASAIAADLLPQIDPRATPTTLSETARALAVALGAALKSAPARAALAGATPLLSAPPRDAAQLSAALGDVIGASGLFYESHLAEWSRGERPLAQLSREPQMQYGFGDTAGAPTAAGSALAADAAQLVNLQLASHEQALLAWQGQLWPGQELDWQIGKEAPPPGGDDDAAAPLWRSTLRLRFPQLGDVAATLLMSGDQLRIELQAGSQQTGELLRAHADALTGAFEAAGAALASLRIHAAPQDQDG